MNAEIHLDETNPHLHFNFVPIFEINGSTRLNSDPVMKRDNKKAEHVAIRNHMNGISDGRWLFERKKEAGRPDYLLRSSRRLPRSWSKKLISRSEKPRMNCETVPWML